MEINSTVHKNNQPKHQHFSYWNMHKAIPSVCHMSLVKLIEEGHLKHIISQNIDGLHRKSGVPADKISELHGN